MIAISEIPTRLLAWLAGGVLGAMFFGGLWWTVAKGLSSQRPAVWFLASLWLRITLVLAGFYVVSGNHWDRLMLCLLGFVMARWTAMWATRNKTIGANGESRAP
jgi:F1F0 ATPase subunit 2